MEKRQILDELLKWRYAHRGFHNKPVVPENSMTAFKALDGTMFRDHEEKNKVQLTQEEKAEMAKAAIEKGAQGCIAAIRIYEPIWRETYAEMVKFMQENPIAPQQEGQANA